LRHIDYGWAGGLDDIDRLIRRLLHLYLLLLVAAQCAGVVGLSAEPLNRCRDGVLIIREGLPDGGIVIDVSGHHRNDGRKIHQCNEGWIESLFLRRVGKRDAGRAGIGFQPGIDIQDFLRICGCRGDLGEQRIRVKRDRRQQLVKFFGCWRRCRLRPEQRAGRLKRHQPHQQKSYYRTYFAQHKSSAP
jgi:hypothetical protein